MPLLIHSLTWRPSSKSHFIIVSLHKMLSPPGLELRRTKYVVIYFTPECLTSVTVVSAVVWLLKTRLVVCHCKNRACPCEYFPRNCGSSTRYPGSTSLLQQKIIYWGNKEVDSWQGIESCSRSCLSDALDLPASWSSRPELLKNITSAYVTSGFWKIFTYFYFEMSLLTATELIRGENDLHRGSMRRRCHSPKRLEGQEAFEETHFKYR